MNNIENFLKSSRKDEDELVDTSLMEPVGKQYQCQKCDLWSNDSFLDRRAMIIYWSCEVGHQSKVVLNV